MRRSPGPSNAILALAILAATGTSAIAAGSHDHPTENGSAKAPLDVVRPARDLAPPIARTEPATASARTGASNSAESLCPEWTRMVSAAVLKALESYGEVSLNMASMILAAPTIAFMFCCRSATFGDVDWPVAAEIAMVKTAADSTSALTFNLMLSQFSPTPRGRVFADSVD